METPEDKWKIGEMYLDLGNTIAAGTLGLSHIRLLTAFGLAGLGWKLWEPTRIIEGRKISSLVKFPSYTLRWAGGGRPKCTSGDNCYVIVLNEPELSLDHHVIRFCPQPIGACTKALDNLLGLIPPRRCSWQTILDLLLAVILSPVKAQID